MQILQCAVGDYQTNCYLLADDSERVCALIDPGDDPQAILDLMGRLGYPLQYVLLTHGHFDHTGAVRAILDRHPVPVYLHRADLSTSAGGDAYAAFLQFTPADGAKTLPLAEGEDLALGSLTIQVLHTPGHTPGSVSFLVTDGEQRALFTGDTLFRGSCGRVDFPGGSYPAMLASLRKLAGLEGDFAVYPGHDAVTSLSQERQRNPFVFEAVSGHM